MVGSAHELFLVQDKIGINNFLRDHNNHPASLVTVLAFEPSAPTKP